MRPKVNRFRALIPDLSLKATLKPILKLSLNLRLLSTVARLGGIASIAVLVFSSCSMHPGRGIKSCRYHFRSMTFLGMDSQATHWNLDVAVANPNSHEVSLTRLRYALMHETDTLLSGWNPEKRVLAPGDSQLIRTTLDLPNAVLKRLPAAIWSQTDAKFTLVADSYLTTWVGDIVVPNAIRQTVRINMTEQVAKYRDMVMKRFFGWPGSRLEEGGIVAPDSTAPRQPHERY